MGENYLHATEQEMDMVHVVEHEIKSQTPMLLCSLPGYDVSGRVDDLVAETNNQITSIALGSAEGFSEAEKAISASVKSGRWVLLKNVHLATHWLVSLEKKLHILHPHPNFRLFMTMEINPKVPVNLLRASRIFVYEPPPGIKANLLRTFSTVSATRMSQVPGERARLYFLLAWFHAIVQERLRYSPLGWSKAYEFSESDQRVAFDMLDTWIASVSQNRANIPPEKLPWDAFSMLLGQSIYGGKIDNEFDQKLLQSFIDRLFTKKSFESEFSLITNVDGVVGEAVKIPEGVRREQFVQWCEGLPEYQSPSWLGLPNNAEKVILSNLGEAAVVNLLKMRILAEDDELEYVPEISNENEDLNLDIRPQWMKSLQQSVRNWLALLPTSITPIKRTLDNIKDPLFRYFEREVNLGVKLLHDMRQDLENIMEICEGNRKQTNDLRQLIEQLAKGVIPSSWNRYAGPQDLTVIQWMIDLAERMKQLKTVSKLTNSSGAKELKNLKVWLGGLFIPEAYITATRQYVAQANQWSLEELYLNITIADGDASPQTDDCSFIVSGLKLQGAVCNKNLLSLVDTITTELPEASFRWTKIDPRNPPQVSGNDVKLPVYLNQKRSELLFTVDMTTTGDVPARTFYERGVAFIASFLSG
jgi:dynein heavy chain 1